MTKTLQYVRAVISCYKNLNKKINQIMFTSYSHFLNSFFKLIITVLLCLFTAWMYIYVYVVCKYVKRSLKMIVRKTIDNTFRPLSLGKGIDINDVSRTQTVCLEPL